MHEAVENISESVSTSARRKENPWLPCPKCRKLCPIEARICTCGHWFVQPKVRSDESLLPVLRLDNVEDNALYERLLPGPSRRAAVSLEGHRRTRGMRFVRIALVVLGLGVLGSGLVYWGGTLNGSRDAKNAKTLTSAAPSSPDACCPPSVGETGDVVGTGNAIPSSDSNRPSVVVSKPKAAADVGPEDAAVSDRENVPKKTQDEIVTSGTTIASTDSKQARINPANQTPDAKVTSPPISESKPNSNSGRPVARCADGSFSYSRNQGTVCLYRGGVTTWLDPAKQSEKTVAANNASSGQRIYQLGPQGGCFYISSTGSKTYVDKSRCNFNK